MKLYAYYRSSTSYRLRIALALKRIDYQLVPVDLGSAEQRGEAFVAKNPFAGVPMLEADGRQRAQSMAILEWLDEAYPAHPLLPADIEQRFTARELAYAIATELHAPLNLKARKYLIGSLGQDQAGIERWSRHFLGHTLPAIEARLEQLDAGDFLFAAPGLFETVLIPQLYNARRVGFDLSALPHCRRIEAACLAREEFIAAHPDNQKDNPERNKP